MADDGGVLIARKDGVIDVPEAEPWPAQLADQVERILDRLGAPRRAERPERQKEET